MYLQETLHLIHCVVCLSMYLLASLRDFIFTAFFFHFELVVMQKKYFGCVMLILLIWNLKGADSGV
jgi:hypothetical protein